MAHSCPDCDQTCYCNGDIDDILIEDEKHVRRCVCCPIDGDIDDILIEDEEEDADYDEDDLDEAGG